MEKLLIAPNRPVQIALKYTAGKLVNGRFGQQVYYTLAEPPDTCMYLDLEPAGVLKQLAAKAEEKFWIEQKVTGKGQTATWDAWFDRDRKNALAVDLKRATDEVDRQLARIAGARVIPPAPAIPTPSQAQHNGNQPMMTKLESALKTVVAAIHSTNEYAKSIGYTAMPQFTSEDLRCMANTLMIGARQ